jgi:hypothetical protein
MAAKGKKQVRMLPLLSLRVQDALPTECVYEFDADLFDDETETDAKIDWKWQRERAAKAAGRAVAAGGKAAGKAAAKAAVVGGKAAAKGAVVGGKAAAKGAVVGGKAAAKGAVVGGKAAAKGAVVGGKAAAKGAVKGAKVAVAGVQGGAKGAFNEFLGKHRSQGWRILYEKTNLDAVTPSSKNVVHTDVIWIKQGSTEFPVSNGRLLKVTAKLATSEYWKDPLATFFRIEKKGSGLKITFYTGEPGSDDVKAGADYDLIGAKVTDNQHRHAKEVIELIVAAIKASNQHSQLLTPGAYA